MTRIEQFRRTPLGWYLGPLFATFAWTLLWAGYDVAVVGVAFRCAPCLFPNEWAYWITTWDVLFPITSMLAFRRWGWLPILAVWLGGWEDVLFYWVQGHAVPRDVSYLFLTPTDTVLYLRALAFLITTVLCMRFYRRRVVGAKALTDQTSPVEKT